VCPKDFPEVAGRRLDGALEFLAGKFLQIMLAIARKSAILAASELALSLQGMVNLQVNFIQVQ